MTVPPSHSQPADKPVQEPPLVHRVELAISYLLRVGVLLSIALVVAGSCLTYVHHPDYAAHKLPLADVPRVARDFPDTVKGTLDSLREGRGQGFILLGLLVLLITPVLRVAVSIIAFLLQGDRIFAVITALVLAILILSFLLGKTEG